MPTTEQILAGLRTISNAWRVLAIFWHVYFAALSIGLVAGVRPSKRYFGVLLCLPLLSVSLVAWLSGNPFNGLVFALLGFALIYVTFRFREEKIQTAGLWPVITGIAMIIFGWIYPHFLDTPSPVSYLYAAPTGIIPCATLSIVVGFALVLGNFRTRAFATILGITGLFYSLTGIFQLGVKIDWFLLVGTILLLSFAFFDRRRT
ncbi:MAG: hypothetical protein QME85_11620 [Candidatus Saccharicenans sp.]|nr:hypothetical protein [Candidatus Saccharicenans sp.]